MRLAIFLLGFLVFGTSGCSSVPSAIPAAQEHAALEVGTFANGTAPTSACPGGMCLSCNQKLIILSLRGETIVALRNTGLYGQCASGPPCIVLDDAGTCFPTADVVSALRKAKRP